MNKLYDPENIELHNENAALREELRHKQNTIDHLSNSYDKASKVVASIQGITSEYAKGIYSAEMALSYINLRMRQRR